RAASPEGGTARIAWPEPSAARPGRALIATRVCDTNSLRLGLANSRAAVELGGWTVPIVTPKELMISTRLRIGAALSALALGLTACGSDATEDTSAAASGESTTIEVEDNNGTQTLTVPPRSDVATATRTSATPSAGGAEHSATAVRLLPVTIPYSQDEQIIDLGSHREPDLESGVAADPDLIVNGQRFTQYTDGIAELVPEATILTLDPRDDEPFDAELKRQTSVLGEVFGKESEAEQLNSELDAAIERVKPAYQPG